MAKPSWLSLSKTQGEGDDVVGVSTSSDYRGRLPRYGNITFRAASVQDVISALTQNGMSEYVMIDAAKAAPQAGGNITIEGRTNSSKLTFSLGVGDLIIALPSSYSAHSLSTNNGAVISGDPGAMQEIVFSITIATTANGGIDALTRQLVVTANGGQTALCLITQAATSPTLSISPESITLDYTGAEKFITVTSNTSWEII